MPSMVIPGSLRRFGAADFDNNIGDAPKLDQLSDGLEEVGDTERYSDTDDRDQVGDFAVPDAYQEPLADEPLKLSARDRARLTGESQASPKQKVVEVMDLFALSQDAKLGPIAGAIVKQLQAHHIEIPSDGKIRREQAEDAYWQMAQASGNPKLFQELYQDFVLALTRKREPVRTKDPDDYLNTAGEQKAPLAHGGPEKRYFGGGDFTVATKDSADIPSLTPTKDNPGSVNAFGYVKGDPQIAAPVSGTDKDKGKAPSPFNFVKSKDTAAIKTAQAEARANGQQPAEDADDDLANSRRTTSFIDITQLVEHDPEAGELLKLALRMTYNKELNEAFGGDHNHVDVRMLDVIGQHFVPSLYAIPDRKERQRALAAWQRIGTSAQTERTTPVYAIEMPQQAKSGSSLKLNVVAGIVGALATAMFLKKFSQEQTQASQPQDDEANKPAT